MRFPATRLLLAWLVPIPVSTLAAQQAEPRARPQFYVVRYASRSALAMYSGYRVGPALLVAGLLHNPRSNYREFMAGAGRPVALRPGNAITVVVAGAHTNTGDYAQLYLLPELRAGAATFSGTLQYGEPLESRGARQLNASPATLLVGGGTVALGFSYYLSLEQGAASTHAGGPAVQLSIPRGALTLELVRGLAHAPSELRLAVRTGF